METQQREILTATDKWIEWMIQSEMANERAKEQSYKVGNSDRRIHYNLWSNHYFHVLCNVGVLNVFAVCTWIPYAMHFHSFIHSHGRLVVRSIGSVRSFVSKSQPVFIGDISFRCDIVFALIEIDLIKYRLFIWFCVHNIAICTNPYFFYFMELF